MALTTDSTLRKSRTATYAAQAKVGTPARDVRLTRFTEDDRLGSIESLMRQRPDEDAETRAWAHSVSWRIRTRAPRAI